MKTKPASKRPQPCNKTDRNDAYHLALAQDRNQHQPNRKEPEVYHQLQSLSRAYEELTHDIVASKNRLHKYLQLTFPELETIFNNSRGVNYWYLVELFPHCQDVRNLDVSTIAKQIEEFKGYGINRAQKLAIKLKPIFCQCNSNLFPNSLRTSCYNCNFVHQISPYC
ncbi:IS110 family transposase [Lactiplantibacillus pentosus]|uniref:Transposase n=1 Tax=Lactiplantibacillus pentosus IG1 TaxID=1042160 RepID=G0LYN3_LACPE|nr:IS110 family transposase [Lactiplantibacillus pentosus]CCC15457.1 transposase [Lactiplantibacillus pentosus IG1]